MIEAWNEAWQAIKIEIARVEEVAPDHLVLDVDQNAVGAGSGAPVRMEVFWLFVFREGLGSIFRTASVVPFTEVEAILAGAAGDPPMVGLLRTGDLTWPLGVPADHAEGERVVAALRAVGGWRVVRGQALHS